ncbi:MAG: zinc-ribbon domain-containing protein, partial [Candidatus Heimdallarchaeota archaeon]|nr:zinc-ribbon domain-containing protein [Candidatus Heimdallarchaeota archaeon]
LIYIILRETAFNEKLFRKKMTVMTAEEKNDFRADCLRRRWSYGLWLVGIGLFFILVLGLLPFWKWLNQFWWGKFIIIPLIMLIPAGIIQFRLVFKNTPVTSDKMAMGYYKDEEERELHIVCRATKKTTAGKTIIPPKNIADQIVKKAKGQEDTIDLEGKRLPEFLVLDIDNRVYRVPFWMCHDLKRDPNSDSWAGKTEWAFGVEAVSAKSQEENPKRITQLAGKTRELAKEVEILDFKNIVLDAEIEQEVVKRHKRYIRPVDELIDEAKRYKPGKVIQCPNCGEEIKVSDKFCSYCGKELEIE